jgi:lipopolysaccharide biosynthesis glycosyltransferase
MNVSGDFRAQAHDIATRCDGNAAVAFMRENPPPAEFSNADPHNLRLWADVAFTAGDLKQALRIYQHLTKVNPSFFWPFFQLGRIGQLQGDITAAIEQFRQAAVFEKRFPWTWYELCQCYLDIDESGGLKEAAVGFAEAEKTQLNKTQAELLTSAAHRLFEERLREEPYQIYRLLIEQGFATDLVRTRHSEYFIWRGEFSTAVTLLEPLYRSKNLGDWGVRSLAFAYLETERFAEAEALLEVIVRKQPKNVNFLRDYLRSLERQDKHAQADAALTRAKPHIGVPTYETLHLMVLAERGQPAALIDVLAKNPNYGGDSVRADLARVIHQLAYQRKDYVAARLLIDYFQQRFGRDIGMVLCDLNVAFSVRDWELAARLFGEVTEAEYADNIELRVKRFEYHCLIGDIAQAREALKALEPVPQLPKRFIPVVTRFHAEVGEWQSAFGLAMQLIDLDFDFKLLGYLTFRTIRKTKMHAAALRQIEQVDSLESSRSLLELRTIVMEDMVKNDYMLDDLLSDPNIADINGVRQRLMFKKLVLQSARAKKTKKRYAIYYCTNDDYLCPTLVSLVSLAETNSDLLSEADLFIVVDDSTMKLVRRIGEKLARSLGVDINLVTRKEIVSESTELKVNYGLFTGGQRLSESAYYRIFFAQKLLELGQHERALYIDSDTIIRGSLRELLEFPIGLPLAARLEDNRPEVDAAIRINQLEPGKYFNSGVLAFDLTDKNVGAGLERTVHAIHHSHDTLMFHDQCALNIGFKSTFRPLDSRFNYFVKPQLANAPLEATELPDAVIIHYLDRPKPWDPAYPRDTCRHWFASWHKLALKVGGTDAMTLYGLSNRG